MSLPWGPEGPLAPTRFEVKVSPGSKKNSCQWLGPLSLKMHLTAPAVDGKANGALLENLCEIFSVRPRQIKMVRGEKNRVKIVEVSPP